MAGAAAAGEKIQHQITGTGGQPQQKAQQGGGFRVGERHPRAEQRLQFPGAAARGAEGGAVQPGGGHLAVGLLFLQEHLELRPGAPAPTEQNAAVGLQLGEALRPGPPAPSGRRLEHLAGERIGDRIGQRRTHVGGVERIRLPGPARVVIRIVVAPRPHRHRVGGEARQGTPQRLVGGGEPALGLTPPPCVGDHVFVLHAEVGVVLARGARLPGEHGDEIGGAEDFVEHQPQGVHLVVVDADEQHPVVAQQLPGQHQARIDHVQPGPVTSPFVVGGAGAVTATGAEIILVQEVAAGVVGRVDVDHLHPLQIAFSQTLEHRQVVALDHAVGHPGSLQARFRAGFEHRRRRASQRRQHRRFARPAELVGLHGPRIPAAGLFGVPQCQRFHGIPPLLLVHSLFMPLQNPSAQSINIGISA